MDNAITLALVSILGAVITALFKMLTDTIKANTQAISRMAESSEKVARVGEIGNFEAKERNGHLGEQNVQITELIVSQTETLRQIKDSCETTAETLVSVRDTLTAE